MNPYNILQFGSIASGLKQKDYCILLNSLSDIYDNLKILYNLGYSYNNNAILDLSNEIHNALQLFLSLPVNSLNPQYTSFEEATNEK